MFYLYFLFNQLTCKNSSFTFSSINNYLSNYLSAFVRVKLSLYREERSISSWKMWKLIYNLKFGNLNVVLIVTIILNN